MQKTRETLEFWANPTGNHDGYLNESWMNLDCIFSQPVITNIQPRQYVQETHNYNQIFSKEKIMAKET